MSALNIFQDMCRREAVLEFAEKTLTESYSECMPQYSELVGEFVREIFETIGASCIDDDLFLDEIERLRTQIFHDQNDSFWFNHQYKHYKRFAKPQYRALELDRILRGKRILDFGCGDGLMSLALSQKGYQVYLADEIDYRDTSARHLPFVEVSGEWRLDFPDAYFEEAVVFGVLHHIEATRSDVMLGELTRVSQRLIIEEDIVCPSLEPLPSVNRSLADDKQLRDFALLSPGDQRGYLIFMDYYGNCVVRGISTMSMPFSFRTVAGWQELFEMQGLSTIAIIPKGFQRKHLHRTSQIWFVLSSAPEGMHSHPSL